MSLERESWAEGSQQLSGEYVWHCRAEVPSKGQCPSYNNCHCKAVGRAWSLGRAWELRAPTTWDTCLPMVRSSDINGLLVCPGDEEA